MSHLYRVKSKLNDSEALVAALVAIGFTPDQIEVHDEAEPLTNYYGRKEDRGNEQRAHVIIRNRHCRQLSAGQADIGWIREADGTYSLVADNMQTGEHGPLGRAFQQRLQQEHTLARTIRTVEARGMEARVERVGREITVRATPRLALRR
jgi:hypothetical protein